MICAAIYGEPLQFPLVNPWRKAYIIFGGRRMGSVVVKNTLLALMAAAAILVGIIYFAGKRSQPTPVEAGIPEYPGAAAVADSFSMRLPGGRNNESVTATIYRTGDPPEKVITFYKQKLAGKIQVLERDLGGNASAAFRTSVNGKSILIMISTNEDAKETEIAIGTLASPPTH
jgi:hypothetical protein